MTSCLLFIFSKFLRGNANQRFNKRPPIGELVLSIIFKSVTAFKFEEL